MKSLLTKAYSTMRKLLLSLVLCLLFMSFVSAQERQTPYEIALERIEEVRVSGAIGLDLGNLGLLELPSELFNLHSLQTLYLHNNKLSSLPPEIGNLYNLQRLYLPYNHLSNLPPEIAQLKELCLLDLGTNWFQHLPTELAELSQLSRLADESPCRVGVFGLFIDNNPLISPPAEVIAQGTPAILDYLENEAWWHLQRLITGGAGSIGIIAATVLWIRWRNRRGYEKKKKHKALAEI